MNILNISITVTLWAFLFLTGCSNDPTIISASIDKVTIDSPAEKFLEAYELAKKECQKNSRYAEYIADETNKLEEVAFNCIGEEVVAEAVTETEAEAATDAVDEAETTAEPVEETTSEAE